jgi:hypothetical protein
MDTVAFFGMIMAMFAVSANDSVQTLGTFIASNDTRKMRIIGWAGASILLSLTVFYGYLYSGDISFGRLDHIPAIEIYWYHLLGPAILLILTACGVPVSTSFIVLSAFATTVVMEKMLFKSVMGYGLAAIVGYLIWIVLARVIDESEKVVERNKGAWTIAQWLSTSVLWVMWLQHDLANIAVFMPRNMELKTVFGVCIVMSGFLGWTFSPLNKRMQKIVMEKRGTRYIRSATIIDLVYAFILFFFIQYNSIPMSTTFVFIGLLCGRELAIATVMKDHTMDIVFPMVIKDFLKLLVGLASSIGVVLTIHYIGSI